MSTARKEMEAWAHESQELADKLEFGNATREQVAEFLQGNAKIWARYARILSRLERNLKAKAAQQV